MENIPLASMTASVSAVASLNIYIRAVKLAHAGVETYKRHIIKSVEKRIGELKEKSREEQNRR